MNATAFIPVETGGYQYALAIDYDPYPSQQRFHDLTPGRYKGFSGPVGSGKSRALCVEALCLSAENRGCMGLIGAPTYPMLRDVTYRAMLELLAESGVSYTPRAAEFSITLDDKLCGGSLIVFRTMEHAERLRGPNLAWALVDEMTYCREESWLRLEARVRDPKAKRLALGGCWTPKGFNWVYEKFVSPDAVKGYQVVLAAPGEAKGILTHTPDYYERLAASYDERFYRQEVLGEYLSLQAGMAYYAFDKEKNLADVAFQPFSALLWALDFNVNPMTAVIAQERPGKRVVVLEEIILGNSSTEKMCAEFWERLQPYLKVWRSAGNQVLPIKIYGDASGHHHTTAATQSDWEVIELFLRSHKELKADWQVTNANPQVRDRVVCVNSMLRAMDGTVKLFISPKCVELRKDFEQVVWAEGSSTGLEKRKAPMRTHVSDALGYLIWRDFRVDAFVYAPIIQ